MLQLAANQVRGTRYDALVPDLERDIASIRAWPPGAPPGRLDRRRFLNEFERRHRWWRTNQSGENN